MSLLSFQEFEHKKMGLGKKQLQGTEEDTNPFEAQQLSVMSNAGIGYQNLGNCQEQRMQETVRAQEQNMQSQL